MSQNGKCFLDVYNDIMSNGNELAPRGHLIKEIENYQFLVTDRFSSFIARKFSPAYLKAEMLWYLSGDPYNDMITDHAQIWTDIRQPDGMFFSNYGQYWFNAKYFNGVISGFEWVVHTLQNDPDSRQAIIPMLASVHCFDGNKDVVCTEAISFRIRNDKLNMSVNMRSNDAIWGMTNDVACFSFLHEMVAIAVGVQLGDYMHKADSMHIYERHFNMAATIINDGESGFYTVDCPRITDVNDLLSQQYKSDFGLWLKS